MDTLINIFTAVDIFLAILLVVVSIAVMDRRYAAKVRAETIKKEILRGERRDDL